MLEMKNMMHGNNGRAAVKLLLIFPQKSSLFSKIKHIVYIKYLERN